MRLPAVLVACVFAALSLAATRAAACSVCGCDPAALTVGLDRPSSSTLRVGVEDRYLVKESGEGAAFEGERENRMMLRAQFAPVAPSSCRWRCPSSSGATTAARTALSTTPPAAWATSS